MEPRAIHHSVRHATCLFLTALLSVALAPGASAHPVHCDSDGNHSVWLGAYLDQLDPTDPDTVTSGLVEQGFGCCYLDGDVIRCDLWDPRDVGSLPKPVDDLPDMDLVEQGS